MPWCEGDTRPLPAEFRNKVTEQAQRILASRQFRRGRPRELFQFLLHAFLSGRHDLLTEEAAGEHVFERSRKELYEGNNRLVAVNMHHVRARLKDYYSTLGADDPISILFPRGYTPVVDIRGHLWSPWPPNYHGHRIAIGPALCLPGRDEYQTLPRDFCEQVAEQINRRAALLRACYIPAGQSMPPDADYQILTVLEESRADEQLHARLFLLDQRGSQKSAAHIPCLSRLWRDSTSAAAQWAVSAVAGLSASAAATSMAAASVKTDMLGVTSMNEILSHVKQRSPEALQNAMQELERQLAEKPHDAQLLAAMAEVKLISPWYLAMPTPGTAFAEAFLCARQAAVQAPGSAPTQTVLAYLQTIFNRDPVAAISTFELALRLDPNYARAHQWMGNTLVMIGDCDKAEFHYRKALAAAPDEPIILKCAGDACYYSGDYARAVDAFSESIRRHDFWMSYLFRGLCYGECSELDRAMSDLTTARGKNPSAGHVIDGAIGNLQARFGDTAAARAILVDLLSLHHREHGVAHSVAVVCAGLGRKHFALEWLEHALADPIELLYWAAVDPRFRELRCEPDFESILKRLGLLPPLLLGKKQ